MPDAHTRKIKQKGNTPTVPKRFAIVSELFQAIIIIFISAK